MCDVATHPLPPSGAAVSPAILANGGALRTRRTASTTSDMDYKPVLCQQKRQHGSTVLTRDPAVGTLAGRLQSAPRPQRTRRDGMVGRAVE